MKTFIPFFIFFLLIFLNINVFSQVANFNISDTVCINQNVTIQNTSFGGNTYYWTFCSASLSDDPICLNLGNIGLFNRPVYSSIAKDGNNYYVFVSNYSDGTISRLNFGDNITNAPVATNLGNFGVLQSHIEGIQIKKDSLSGNWFGLILGGENNYIVRLFFGSSLNNFPTAINWGNLNNSLSYPHTIYTFSEGGKWYSLIGNYINSTLVRLNFGNSLANVPSTTILGNIGDLDGPVGFYPIQENGDWYLFVVNDINGNHLSRLYFGNSLTNLPSGENIGNLGGAINTPRSITILKYCDQIFGFVVNRVTNSLVRLTFPNGLSNLPIADVLGNIANFSFPHNISEFVRVNESIYSFIMNANNSTISRICFPNSNSSSIPSSNLFIPPPYFYKNADTYNVRLVVDEGLPTQSIFCKEVVAVESPSPVISGDTLLCVGDTLRLSSSLFPSSLYQWSGPNGFTSTNPCLVIPNIDTSNSGKYQITVTNCNNTSSEKFVRVENVPTVELGNDTILCKGNTIILDAGNIGCNYLWSTGENNQTIEVMEPGHYSVIVRNNKCSSTDNILINECETELLIPNVFTPNQDGLNERFKPIYHGTINSFQINVFNRWGQKVYESKDVYEGWDGRLNGRQCPCGVYFYIIEYSTGIDQSLQKHYTKRGFVTVLR
jgi:gliding motility-associated-like protein